MLITNARVVTWGEPNELLEDHALLLAEGRIADLGPTEILRSGHRDPEVLDARGQLAMPGNLCAHTHFYGAFARGMAIPGAAPQAFPEILGKLWWPLDRSLREEDIRYSALVCLIDAVRHGTTTLIDHHASPNAIDGSLDVIAAAVEEAGFHIHAAEHLSDQKDSLARTGLKVIERLDRHGILGPRTIAAHAVHIGEREIGLLARSQTWVTHQPRSNMNNGVGVAPVENMLAAGVRVGLGNDGFSNGMWEEWKTAYLLQKVWHRDPRRMPGEQVVKLAVYNNASLVGQFFPEAPIGVLAPGAHVDLILVDYHPTTPLDAGNLPWHILFGFHESLVTTTIVAGKVLMRDRELVTLDEEAITARSRELAAQVWKQYHQKVAAG